MKRAFHIMYTILALNFFIPVLVYVFEPVEALNQFTTLGSMLGGGDYAHAEDSVFWRVLAIANVATLGFCCVLLQINLQKFWAAIYPLVFLKGCASFGFGVAYIIEAYPGYLAGCLFDMLTCGLFVWFARAAKDSDEQPS